MSFVISDAVVGVRNTANKVYENIADRNKTRSYNRPQLIDLFICCNLELSPIGIIADDNECSNCSRRLVFRFLATVPVLDLGCYITQYIHLTNFYWNYCRN